MTRVYVAPVSFGLGDLVVSLPAIQALIEQSRHDGEETWLVTRSVAQARLAERIAGLTGSVDEESFDRDDHDGRLVDLRDHPLQRDWWWGSAEFEDAFGTLAINDVLGRICADFGIDADFTRPVPLVLRVHGPEARRRPCSWWPRATGRRNNGRWTAGSRLAGRAPGERPRRAPAHSCDEAAPEMRAASGSTQTGAPSPGEALDMLGAAAAVVGIDTGLTHSRGPAGNADRHDLPRRSVYFRPWPHVPGGRGRSLRRRCGRARPGSEPVQRHRRLARVALAAADVPGRDAVVSESVHPDDVLGRALESVL